LLKLYVSEGKRMVTVPSLNGLNLAEATGALVKAELRLGEVSSWFSDGPLGEVFEHSAQDSNKIAVGSAVDLKLSLGAIPVVAGLDERVATTALEAVGLEVSKVAREFSDTVPEGQVISLLPDQQQLTNGGSVTLTVSKGPDLVAVPAVIGETLLAAKGALEAAGFVVIVDTNQLSSKWGIATVKRVSEPAGTMLTRGSSITISSR
jgi:serine/threonine-protein kinase